MGYEDHSPPFSDAMGPTHLKDKNIQGWSRNGIAVHHAGLEAQDRLMVEGWFRNGRLKMIVCTSVGVVAYGTAGANI